MGLLLNCFLILVLSLGCSEAGMQYGMSTFNITTYPGSQCKSIAFSSAHSGSSSDVRVQITLHEVGPTFEAAVAWVESVTLIDFTACVETAGPINGGRVINLQYVSFVSVPSGGVAGIQVVPLHTAGTKCVVVTPPGVIFTKVPHVFVTAVHTVARKNNQRDAASVWTEDVSISSFKVCLRELKNFDGVHRNLRVDWLMLQTIPSGWSRIQYESKITLPNNVLPTEDDHYSFCKSVAFPNTFYSMPTMITTASHRTDGALAIKPDNNAITEWIESVDVKGFKVCLKDIQPFDARHDPVTVHYLALGFLHPCLSIKCPWYEVCKAYGPLEAKCECDEPCPLYEAQVCGSDGVTYKNYCKYKLAVCRVNQNITIAHNGSCFPFIIHRGRVELRLDTSDVQCKTVVFTPANFKNYMPVRVETSVNYYSSNGSFVHDAAVSWAEETSLSSFQVCVLKAGRLDRLTPDSGLTYVDYIAYQSAPVGSVTGEQLMSDWWEGTTCQTVVLPKDKFSSPPYVLVTAEHMVKDQKHDAATSWVEEVTPTSFKVCLRELQDFDGLHKEIYVNWLAYETMPDALSAESRQLSFPNSGTPNAADNHAFCQVLTFGKSYSKPPTVIVSSKHTPGAGKLLPDYNSIATWVEYISNGDCKVCLRELQSESGSYDPLTVGALVIGT